MLNINAIVKKMAPPKHGVKNGIVPGFAQPKAQDFLFNQPTNSIAKLVQANKKPINKTINCTLISFFIKINLLIKFPITLLNNQKQ